MKNTIKIYNKIIIKMTLDEAIKHCNEVACKHDKCAMEHKQLAEWLKELKELRSQTTWKPSEEQMKALNYVVNLMASSESPKENDYYYNVFKDLKEQLKQL